MLTLLPEIKKIIKNALQEDIGSGDITTRMLPLNNKICQAYIVFRQKAVICGLPLVKFVYKQLDSRFKFVFHKKDGWVAKKGEIVAEITGPADKLLNGERVVLNFIQRLSGIATYTRNFVQKVKGTKAKILDTRKTTPTIRILEKYAVRVGGGQNHRMGLYDAILIKDNHLNLSRLDQVYNAIKKMRKKYFVEIEAKNFLEAVVFSGFDVDAIMLDNFSISEIRKTIKVLKKIAPRKIIEVSGGVNLDNVRQIAKAGADWISVGSLTHSAPAVDIALKLLT